MKTILNRNNWQVQCTTGNEQKGQKQSATLPYIFAHNVGSNCLACSEFLRAANCCQHKAKFAIRKNKTHAKLKRFTVNSCIIC